MQIDRDTRTRIEDAKAQARRTPVPLDWVQRQAALGFDDRVSLADRPEDFSRPRSRNVLIGRSHRAGFSYEEQPSGLVAHLSVSVGTPAVVPGSDDLLAIAAAFGFPGPGKAVSRAWTEEFEPGEWAVHLAWLVEG